MKDRFEFLRAMGENRRIDRILIVTDDVPIYQSHMQKYFDYSAGTFFCESEETVPDCLLDGKKESFTNYRINIPLAGGRELSVVQPVAGETPYHCYLEQYGSGVMGLRELVSAEQWKLWKAHVRDEHIPVIATQGDYGMTIDLRKELGCIMEILRDERADEKKPSARRIGQVCISTDDIHRTAEDMVRLLGIGPWEIGHINNRSADYLSSSDYRPENFPKADFLAGIAFYGDLEFELIQPLEGPLPYFDFLSRHGVGFQHIKEILTPTMWDETNRHYQGLGVPLALGGKVGPCSFANLGTEPLLGFVYELGGGVSMTSLPEGYDPYMYPTE